METSRYVDFSANKNWQGKIGTIQTFQEVVNHMSGAMAPHEGPEEVFGHLQAERVELEEALVTGDRQAIASEIADELIFLTRLAGLYAIDVQESVENKLARNAFKYPNEVARGMRESGMSAEEVRLQMKSDWNRADDKFFKIK